ASRGVRIAGEGLATWRELGLTMRSRGGGPYENHVVRLGWAKPKAGQPTARYVVQWTDSVAQALSLDAQSTFVFEVQAEKDTPRPLAAADTAPAVGPMPRPSRWGWLPGWLRRGPPDSAQASDSAKQASGATKRGGDTKKEPAGDSAARRKKGDADSVVVLDFRVELETADGRTASVALSELNPLPPPLTIRLYKWGRPERRFGASSRDYDQVLTRYAIPLARLERDVPGFRAAQVRAVRFVFDRTAAGTVLMDGMGFER
ncbi:MAG: hypothetical protein FJ363_01335, partial [Gemmatimonadetes bacterium]|nr:hypothetical protein [Gemmatimonadota bacterium]